MMCVDAANLTASIDAVNFLLTLADAPSIFKKLTLGVAPSKFQLFCAKRQIFLDYNTFLCFFRNKPGIL